MRVSMALPAVAMTSVATAWALAAGMAEMALVAVATAVYVVLER